jgi:hypothetical protein
VKHLIEADPARGMVTIERLMEDDSVVFRTSLTFDQVRRMGFEEFARQTGETLIFESPARFGNCCAIGLPFAAAG